VHTLCFDRGWAGAPQRILRNATVDRWESAGCPQWGSRPGEDDVIARRANGDVVLRYEDTPPEIGMIGTINEMCLYSGTGVGDINAVQPAGALVAQIWQECQAVLNETNIP
jgi:hypothetical protein